MIFMTRLFLTTVAAILLVDCAANPPLVDSARPPEPPGSPFLRADPVDVTSGILGLWKLDEGVGEVAADSSGNGHHGTLEGGASWTDGRFGGAGLALDGNDDHVQI